MADILDKGLWSVVSDRAEQQFIHMEVGQFDPTGGPFRMAFVLKGVREDSIPDIRVFASNRDAGFNREPLSHRMAWRLRMPDPMGGQRMVLVVAIDVDLEEATEELLVATEANPMCTMLNAVMVANAPVSDGRR